MLTSTIALFDKQTKQKYTLVSEKRVFSTVLEGYKMMVGKSESVERSRVYLACISVRVTGSCSHCFSRPSSRYMLDGRRTTCAPRHYAEPNNFRCMTFDGALQFDDTRYLPLPSTHTLAIDLFILARPAII